MPTDLTPTDAPLLAPVMHAVDATQYEVLNIQVPVSKILMSRSDGPDMVWDSIAVMLEEAVKRTIRSRING